ncbi:MAG: helix-turn-helix transcriptional regulator, partial [Ruminococcaceae bacterium]|nr:helix-turn-helix transcriptional regulator [Oscillospiraceae bacterium]
IISEVKYYRIEYAKYLLISTNMTVSAISLSCGYKNDVHFMRIFKDLNGISPSEFRKKYRVSTEEIKNSKNKNPFSL